MKVGICKITGGAFTDNIHKGSTHSPILRKQMKVNSNKKVKTLYKLKELNEGKTRKFYSCKEKVDFYKCRET